MDRRWYKYDKNAPHEGVYASVQEVLAAETQRIREQIEVMRVYRQRYATGNLEELLGLGKTSRNVLRSVASTVHSRLIALKPIPFFCSESGDVDLRTRLEHLNEAVAGLFLSTRFEGEYASPWCLQGVLLGTSFLRVTTDGGRVGLDRVYPWEVLVDPLDGLYGQPRTIYQMRWVDRPVLMELFPGKQHRNGIKSASGERPSWVYWLRTLGDPVMVMEAWHLPQGDTPGRHVVCTTSHTLLDEEYLHPEFPLIPFHYSDPEEGFWADGVGQRLYSRQIEIDRITAAVREAIRRCAWPRVFVPQGSQVEDAHLDNTIGSIISYTGGVPPTMSTAHGITAEAVNYLRDLVASCYEDEGVSQNAAMAQKPAGLQSGRALRIYADQQDGRLREPGEKWTRARTRLGEALVRAQREVSKENPRVPVLFSNAKTRTTTAIWWADVDVTDRQMEMVAQPVSSLPQTPAARAALLEEMYNAGSGVITLEEYRDGLDLPDISALTSGARAPRRTIEKILDRICQEGVYTPPQPFFPLDLARKLGVERYCQAFNDEQPPEILDLLQRWCMECRDQQLRIVQAEQAPPPSPPMGGEPMVPDGMVEGLPPGMPPGMPQG